MKREYILPELEILSFAIDSNVANVNLGDMSGGDPFGTPNEELD